MPRRSFPPRAVSVPSTPDIHAIQGRFSDAVALLRCVHVALMEGEAETMAGDASAALTACVALLEGIYDDFERAIAALPAPDESRTAA
jgi:hypothetical protein